VRCPAGHGGRRAGRCCRRRGGRARGGALTACAGSTRQGSWATAAVRPPGSWANRQVHHGQFRAERRIDPVHQPDRAPVPGSWPGLRRCCGDQERAAGCGRACRSCCTTGGPVAPHCFGTMCSGSSFSACQTRSSRVDTTCATSPGSPFTSTVAVVSDVSCCAIPRRLVSTVDCRLRGPACRGRTGRRSRRSERGSPDRPRTPYCGTCSHAEQRFEEDNFVT
jgi:hypothetical protein